MHDSSSKLKINNELYALGLQFIQSRKHFGEQSYLKFIERVASWAYFHHPGRFADGALENPVFHLGADGTAKGKPCKIEIPRTKSATGKTLHVATTLYEVGGHSRFLVKWIERDRRSEHLVILTSQIAPIPSFFKSRVSSSGNQWVCLPPKESIHSRALALREIAKDYDRVILHTHPSDCIPIIAFAKPEGAPVALFNHAHFSFNLSSSVSDMIINTGDYFRSISERFRFARRTYLLPGVPTLEPLANSPVDKEAARRHLSIPEDAKVAMTIGNEGYFRPMAGYDFFRTARALLQQLPDAYLVIVGVPPASQLVPLDLRTNPQLVLTGRVEDPTVYYRASDVCLESFPRPSLGGLVEAVVYGEAYPVPIYGPGESILRLQLSPVLTHSYRPPDEESYVEHVTRLLSNREQIRAEAQAMREWMIEYDQCFDSHLYALNDRIDGLTHRPGEIPVTEMSETYDCRLLAELDQATTGEKINRLFPFVPALYYHMRTTFDGYQTLGSAVEHISKRLVGGLSKAVLAVSGQRTR